MCIELKKLPTMTKWFSTHVLLNAARRAIISGIFGSYADRRLTHAALDVRHSDTAINLTDEIKPKEDNKIWIDFVADVGDGFDSTYAIAYLLGRKEIEVNGEKLPRGQLLIMGGDEVYSTPTNHEYSRRLELPYAYSFPKSEKPSTDQPPIFLIPGNHDWYDGLTLFLAKFCRGRDEGEYFGTNECESSWKLRQSRSYFAIKLPNNWWIWGVDTQLGEDIDQPQEDYFKKIAKSQIDIDKAKIILCTSEPTWLYEKSKFYKGIDHIASNVIHEYCKNAEIYAVLSGDLHHYNRYESDNCETQFITAGGGGAFLHPTHHLPEEVSDIYFSEQLQNLKLAKKRTNKDEQACFPSFKESKNLALSNWKFPFKNWGFCISLGVIYSIIAFLLTMLRAGNIEFGIYGNNSHSFETALKNLTFSPSSILILLIIFIVLYKYALYEDENTTWYERAAYGAMHAILHFTSVLLLICFLPILWTSFLSMICKCEQLIDWIPRSWSLIILIISMVILGGVIGGFIWGLYLLISSRFFSRHHNDAFSSMRFATYKSFLRICIQDDTLKIYPIGLKNVPARNEWKCNAKAGYDNQNEPKIQPKKNLNPIFIEEPIEINLFKE